MPAGRPSRLEGKVFGELTVIKRVGRERGYAVWECRCSCGAVIRTRTDRLSAKTSPKRFCHMRVHAPDGSLWANTVTNAPERSSYQKMMARCYDVNHDRYPSYGGRGIAVCDRWRKSFRNFLEDMGPKPDKGLSIDRKDNDGDYTPENCRWATNREQSRNKQNTIYVEYQNQRRMLIDVCEEVGAQYGLVKGRLNAGYDMNTALFTPVGGLHLRGKAPSPETVDVLARGADSLGDNWANWFYRMTGRTVEEAARGGYRPCKRTLDGLTEALDVIESC